MYRVETVSEGYALIVNDEGYEASWLANTVAAAEQIAMELNRPEMLLALASFRYEFETGGLELPGGLRLLTDRESQGQLSSTYNDLKCGLIPDTDLKAANGWQVVDLAAMEPIARALAAHRRGCFRGESVLIAAINAASTLDMQKEIDIEADFKAVYQAAYAEVMEAA
ncbi:DUF4376 domain-containing protein [Pseudomonas monteilii]|uniref:DUF4376 domain-containing protein n=1 Tax=Pseudomonas monteilii TaxID=76759 RepID=UPI0018A3DEEF|nr:DUF4376 domain-containing protein [Pseudomonas monteilii]BBV94917.1 hypothetical protein STW0522PSE72_02680 [Pseudomonas monteilii]